MSTEAIIERNVIACGYLDVKASPGSLNRKLWKTWQRCWMVAKANFENSTEPVLELSLSQNKGDHVRRPLRVPRRGLRLFRGRSRTRPFRTWGLVFGGTALLYLAAETEAATQLWMERMRDALWPPELTLEILSVCPDLHKVSLLDDEHSYRLGLLGAYGYFIIEKDNVLTLVHPYSGSALLSWPIADVRMVRLLRKVESMNSGSGVFALCVSSGGELKTYHFYSHTASEAVCWIVEKHNEIKRDSDNLESSADPFGGDPNKILITNPRVNNSDPEDVVRLKSSEENLTLPLRETGNMNDIIKSKASEEYGRISVRETGDLHDFKFKSSAESSDMTSVQGTVDPAISTFKTPEKHDCTIPEQKKNDPQNVVQFRALEEYDILPVRKMKDPNVSECKTSRKYDVSPVKKTIDSYITDFKNSGEYEVPPVRKTNVFGAEFRASEEYDVPLVRKTIHSVTKFSASGDYDVPPLRHINDSDVIKFRASEEYDVPPVRKTINSHVTEFGTSEEYDVIPVRERNNPCVVKFEPSEKCACATPVQNRYDHDIVELNGSGQYDLPPAVKAEVIPCHQEEGVYATICKERKTSINDDGLEKQFPMSSNFGEVRTETFRLPDTKRNLLNASMNSTSRNRVSSESSSTSTDSDSWNDAEEGEHLYESMSEGSSGRWSIDSHIYSEIEAMERDRSQTIYEDVGDADSADDDAYVPPLPRRPVIYSRYDSHSFPEKQRTRTASTLRLERLSNSVEEVLRQIDTGLPKNGLNAVTSAAETALGKK